MVPWKTKNQDQKIPIRKSIRGGTDEVTFEGVKVKVKVKQSKLTITKSSVVGERNPNGEG
ncbi:unnamed protein product [Fusarium graminearum]|uniref:Uncharacterized protein n=1 Tax=Gibberella zeae TaxID=5518 RepID=A0A679NL73_GIBZA|nr:unnamed protein product [Fusarium graminearum]CAG1992812.1 unnamed protein product [Fusarium graminearum]CAG2009185.1 unnamed protein product [Fusarium graminearum]CZS76622.1 unnamed protein product [Fusarium graminearum]